MILRVSLFHSPNSLGIYHKMYTFGSFVCSGRPDVISMGNGFVTCTSVLFGRFSEKGVFSTCVFQAVQHVEFQVIHMFKFTTCICLIGSDIYAIFQPIYNTVQHVFSDTISILVFNTLITFGVP